MVQAPSTGHSPRPLPVRSGPGPARCFGPVTVPTLQQAPLGALVHPQVDERDDRDEDRHQHGQRRGEPEVLLPEGEPPDLDRQRGGRVERPAERQQGDDVEVVDRPGSVASGKPSRRSQILATVEAFSGERTRFGRVARARIAKRDTASGAPISPGSSAVSRVGVAGRVSSETGNRYSP